jgi:hypothetical protein
MSNQQINKRLSEEQVIAILENYLAGEIKAKDARENLGLKKSQFFKLASDYKNKPDDFTIKHKGNNGNRRISKNNEKKILEELSVDKKLIENKNNPIKFYNYSAIKDSLNDELGLKISLNTIINRAKENGFYINKPAKRSHNREVITNLIGELLQHDSSHHQWSPYMKEKLCLITTIDDHSRLMLYAKLVPHESAWVHILALKSVFLTYGCPLKYYADQHSIFRYVKDRDKNSPWMNFTKFTDDVDPQWKKVLLTCKVNPIYALSPQAKGKVERPYRWIQDRLVRIAYKKGLKTIEELNEALAELVEKYNMQWVHSTTKEIPIIRFEEAAIHNKSLFTPFKIVKPNETIDDIFCLKAERVVDNYRKISFNGNELRVPNGRPKYTVNMNMVPDDKNGIVKIRFWQDNIFLGEQTEKLEKMQIVRF